MARYTNAKCKLCRREGIKLFLKGERCLSPRCPLEKKGAVPPGQQSQRRKRGLSEYGLQLREKQKLRRLYGLQEKQFINYYQKAARKRNKGAALLALLEMRLDNVVHRLGFALSRVQARQLVNHSHVLVNNKKVNIPSFQVKKDDLISLTPKSLSFDFVKKALKEKVTLPKWLQKKGPIGKVSALPQREDCPADINEQLVIEYYSR
jgi:small subunit ribosomal protein S4